VIHSEIRTIRIVEVAEQPGIRTTTSIFAFSSAGTLKFFVYPMIVCKNVVFVHRNWYYALDGANGADQGKDVTYSYASPD
jgi:hypothetical protein